LITRCRIEDGRRRKWHKHIIIRSWVSLKTWRKGGGGIQLRSCKLMDIIKWGPPNLPRISLMSLLLRCKRNSPLRIATNTGSPAWSCGKDYCWCTWIENQSTKLDLGESIKDVRWHLFCSTLCDLLIKEVEVMRGAKTCEPLKIIINS